MTINELTNKYIVSKSVHSYVFLAILTLLFMGISLVVDGLIIGNFIGTDGLAAFGIATPVMIFISAIAIIFSSGGGASCSNYAGKGEKKKINNNFTITFLFSLIIGILITLTAPLYIEPLSHFLGASGTLTTLTTSYLTGLMFVTIPAIIFEVIVVYTRLEGASHLEMIAGGAMLTTNIILDIVFVTLLNMGMFGIGLATSIGYTIAFLIIIIELFSEHTSLTFSKIEYILPEIKNIFIFGLPVGLNELYNTIRTLITNNLAIFVGGAIVMGALSILAEVNHLLNSVNLGFGAITLLLGGIFYGEQDKRSLRDVLKVTLKSGIIITIILAIFVIIFAPILVGAFAHHGEVTDTATTALRIFALSLPISLISTIFLNFYNSTKNSLLANFIGFNHSFLLISLFALTLTPFIGQYGIWTCFILGETITLVGLLIIIKIKTGKFPTTIEDFIIVDEEFEKNIKHTLNISIENNMDQVMDLSNQIYEFGEKYFEDKSTVNKVSLCIEEMVGNIVEHGYKSSNKVHYIDIRIIITTKHIIFRIRDDGTPFSPMEYTNENELGKYIGIKMIQGIAKNMDYRSTIGLNNLTITL